MARGLPPWSRSLTGMWVWLLLILLWQPVPLVGGNKVNTGFWYGNERRPQSTYETVPFVSMSIRITQPYQEGPGMNLVDDPMTPAQDKDTLRNLLFGGLTIARQTFDTQFVLDMSYALGISTERVYVNYVKRGEVHFSWESSSVIVNFYFLERNTTAEDTLLTHIADLTNMIQIPTSRLYDTKQVNVTYGVDREYGLIITGWDMSLRLTYAIEVVGGNAVIDNYYMNQGGRGLCDTEDSINFARYCEFERFFEDDVSRALQISYYRVQIMFIKKASFDAVLVHFRITPPNPNDVLITGIAEPSISECILDLTFLVAQTNSTLYEGNVTIRTDPVWGLSNNLENTYKATRRKQEAKFTYKYYEVDPVRLNSPIRMSLTTPYDRCKANHRCNWGVVVQDQGTNDVRYFQRLFDRGNLYQTNLFLDFEDWRLGSRGFNFKGTLPPAQLGASSTPKARAIDGTIRGAHFWPFDQASLGPDIPCYTDERNQGLVLNRDLQRQQIDKQMALVDDLDGRIQWLGDNIEWAQMDARQRSRKDVRQELLAVQDDFRKWKRNEDGELLELSSSMCVNVTCALLFDTSSLMMTGAFGDWNGVIRKTSVGTEVAVFSFNSIYLGPEVEVTIVGQRAISLVSKTSAIINTTFMGHPGTLGGMQGGGSIGRFASDRLKTDVKDVYICDFGDFCKQNRAERNDGVSEAFVSNNVNGLGSGNLRITPFVITTSAAPIREIQVINTQAQSGQTLSGFFQLKFKNYFTPFIPHDCSSSQLKAIIEVNLNLVPPKNAPINPDRFMDGVAGVGLVNVSRSIQSEEEGYTWSITFTTAIGNIEELKVVNYLQGLQSRISIRTHQDANELLGTFRLSYQGASTVPILAAETAEGLRQKLLKLPMVVTAFVTRIDPTRNCDDGLCPNGPLPARGLIWTCYVTTNFTADDVSPTSPSSPVANQVAPFYRFTAVFSDTLIGTNAGVAISHGTGQSPNPLMAQLWIDQPFSLAFGGGGGSYGGLGGKGYSMNPVGPVYNDNGLSDLIGGSGGCMRGLDPFEINAVRGRSTAWGGHGGGAIEIIAANDVVVGTYGKIVLRGGDAGQSSEGGGGGGSGGAALLAAGGVIINDGLIDLRGGDGGYGGDMHPEYAGGGGGGGRLATFAESIKQNAIVNVKGGRCGVYKSVVPELTLLLNVTVMSHKLLPLDQGRTSYLSQILINNTINTVGIDALGYVHNGTTGISKAELLVRIYDPEMLSRQVNNTAISAFGYNESYIKKLQATFNTIMDGNNHTVIIAQVNFLQVVITGHAQDTLFPVRSVVPRSCANRGNTGSFFSSATMTSKFLVRETVGGEKTSRALYMSNNELTNTTSGR